MLAKKMIILILSMVMMCHAAIDTSTYSPSAQVKLMHMSGSIRPIKIHYSLHLVLYITNYVYIILFDIYIYIYIYLLYIHICNVIFCFLSSRYNIVDDG